MLGYSHGIIRAKFICESVYSWFNRRNLQTHALSLVSVIFWRESGFINGGQRELEGVVWAGETLYVVLPVI